MQQSAKAEGAKPSTSRSPPQSSSSGGNVADNEADRVPREPAAQADESEFQGDNPFEHWASPAELLQMRALWADVLNRSRHELEVVTAQLQRVAHERDALAKEVRDVEKLRQLYTTATMQFEAMKAERDAWREERELLVLRLRKISTEMEAAKEAALSVGDAKARELQASNATLTEENLQLLAVLGRLRTELSEAASCRHAEKVAAELSLGKLEQSCARKDNEVSLLKAALEENRTAVAELQAANVAYGEHQAKVRVEVLTSERRHAMELERLREQHADELAEVETRLAEAAAEHAGRLRALEAKLHEELEVHAAARAQLGESVAVALAAKAKQADESAAFSHRLEVELSEVRAVAQGKEQQHSDAIRANNHAIEQLEARLCAVEESKTTLQSEKNTVAARLTDVNAQLSQARVELERLGGEFQRLALQCTSLHAELEQRRNLEAERDAFRIRAEGFERDLRVQLDFYEAQMRQSVATIQVMQQKHQQEREALVAAAAPARRRRHDSSDADAAAKVAAPSEKRTSKKVRPSVAAVTAAQTTPTTVLDPLQILRDSQRAAQALAKSVGA